LNRKELLALKNTLLAGFWNGFTFMGVQFMELTRERYG
jgi:hypothetical protein